LELIELVAVVFVLIWVVFNKMQGCSLNVLAVGGGHIIVL
jgi:hypothetical protein